MSSGARTSCLRMHFYLREAGIAILGVVCLSVSNFTQQQYWPHLRDNFIWDVSMDNKKLIKVLCHPRLDADPRIFWRILRRCKIGIFHSLAHISEKRLIGSSRRYYDRCIGGLRSPNALALYHFNCDSCYYSVYRLSTASVKLESSVVSPNPVK